MHVQLPRPSTSCIVPTIYLLSIKTYRSYYNRKYLTELKGPEIEISAAMGDFSNPITSAHAFRAIFAPLCILML